MYTLVALGAIFSFTSFISLLCLSPTTSVVKFTKRIFGSYGRGLNLILLPQLAILLIIFVMDVYYLYVFFTTGVYTYHLFNSKF